MPAYNSDVRLSRTDLAAALTDEGYPISAATLAGFGTRGGGPPYEIFNGRARYQYGPALAWAKSKTRPGGRRVPTSVEEPAHAA